MVYKTEDVWIRIREIHRYIVCHFVMRVHTGTSDL